ncbi:DNA repair protein RecO [Staphylococcus saprophyticus]|uniref:DNA repair protein RecO n=1 Tax=Staphylococcus saprophyticus subsp. saprophyticus (strain ATCC 15305 / DSM 20229 / NCIMB 8711 / NCTC 7292 / S-41) TaxID=342451 RepID=RECO_STAS1|nr:MULTISPECIES: DNA repair protein RecO [Staphylococcus]Q49Y09.1 RecName: Full=DNA repair protein RecO; AltName: Full=Recombination protein O [Staphylococcus saprophyticus subsp. saprophyticus ATCC 15305 = NCTC 7292]CRV17643.1 DNA repair protein RecO [Streptococcus equi subsp. equi]ASE59273.1 DNA repair protein RecO [Staphylococcus saprophyticus]ASF18041.1 DNA repair protein RecO [Staphylococcus saprophyticus]MBN6755458.1 DNA repair protein RecO [Staphylococcus saprophyticus]MBN6765436.1 DNA
MLIKQKGIIIKTIDYGESDKIITILNEYGAKVPLMVRRAKKSKSGLQANTQLFVYGLFIYSKWKGMGTLSSVDVIDQNYHLRLDIYESSYASLCTETIDRSMETDGISKNSYELLHFVLDKIRQGISAQLMSVVVLLKCMTKFGFNAVFDRCVITQSEDQSKLVGYSFKYDGAISENVAYKDTHAFQLSNKTLYLLDILQKLPINQMSSLSIHETIVDEMSELVILLYKEYAGMYFKSQKLINQLYRLDNL